MKKPWHGWRFERGGAKAGGVFRVTDGLIEAFTVDEVPGFSLAVQWHPEWRVTENEFSMAMFRAFGNACREYAGQRQV